ncbi:MAG: hypothetical protein EPN97_09060 [Alphaproteobacteria bacterium]|nr:MAG: hypothetical protein EPN97_09060 [Alphaproteobacteria bacterium]
MLSKSAATKIILLLLAASLLMGLGRIAMLPPFEGYDETAHYSRLEAEAFATPGTSTGFITTDVEDYYARGPMSPRWIFARAFNNAYHEALKNKTPLRLDDQIRKEKKYTDYRAFFSQPARIQEYTKIYRDQPGPAAFKASKTLNWQFQHPPLYYVVFGKVLRAVDNDPLISRLFTLRTLSYLTAFAGFLIGLFATRRHLELRNNRNAQDISVFCAFYPFVMAVYFEEFARLGNDSLCALLFAINWALLLWYLRKPGEPFIWALLGIIMGLSYLTKMLMLPATVGFLFFMLLQKPAKPGFLNRLAPPATAGAIAFVIGYLSTMNGGFVGSIELAAWMHGKGYVTSDGGIPWFGIFFNLTTMLTSMVYNFTDLATFRAGAGAVTAIFIALLYVLFCWLMSLPRNPRREEWLPLYPLLLLMGGLVLHGVLAAFAYRMGAVGVTPARYIHVEAPALMLIFGGGMSQMLSQRGGRFFTGLLLVGAILFNATIMALRLAFFAGCAWSGDNYSGLQIDRGGEACQAQVILDRLAVLGMPMFGLSCLVAAFLLLIIATVKAMRKMSWEYDM